MPWLKHYPLGKEDPRLVQLEGVCLTLGREPDNDLVLQDPAASRHHARLEPDPRGWILRDLGSSNGTYLNRARVQETILRHGDRVRIGRTLLQFEDPPVVDLPEAQAEPPAPKTARDFVPYIAVGLVLAMAGGWFLLRSKGRKAPAGKAAASGGAAPVAVGTPVPARPRDPARLELHLRAAGHYDQAFDGGDQEWLQEQDLELDLTVDITAAQGPFTGQRRTTQGEDQVEGRVEGGRLAELRWRACRITTRTLAGGREERARDEQWELHVKGLEPSPGGTPLTWAWQGRQAAPAFTHFLTFYPQGARIQLDRLDWRTGDDRAVEPPLRIRIHP